MYKIDAPYVAILKTKVRNSQIQVEELQKVLYRLGEQVAIKIIENEYVEEKSVTTPMDYEYSGFAMIQSKTIIISTRDDYNYFATGISGILDNCLRGYMDFGGLRGSETLSTPVRSISLPDIRTGEVVDTVIIAKSVLATGCTAISLLKKAIEKYSPLNIIVASVFYSDQGIRDLKLENRSCKIYICGDKDTLNENGMLVPGIGDLDSRVNQKEVKTIFTK